MNKSCSYFKKFTKVLILLIICIFFLFLLFGALVYYNSWDFEHKIYQVDKPFKFEINCADENINSFSYSISGKLTGTANLEIKTNSEVLFLKDSFSFNKYNQDYYEDRVILEYSPITASTGNVEIKVRCRS